MARKNDATLDQILYMAFELSKTKWKLGFSSGLGQRPRIRTMEAGDLEQLGEEIRLAKERFGLAADSDVVSCYEAGRDGFWIHRSLESIGVRNLVVDPGSVPVSRRGRRAKTDRLDVGGLLLNLIKYELGETDVWSVVRVPSEVDEDARHLHRPLAQAQGYGAGALGQWGGRPGRNPLVRSARYRSHRAQDQAYTV